MKNKKKLIVVILLLILLVITMVLIITGKNTNSYIILDNNKAIEFKNGVFDYVRDEKYSESFYRVFNQNTYLGNYKIYTIDSTTNDIYFSNSGSDDMFIFEEPLMALSTNVDFIEFDFLEFTDSDFEMFLEISSNNDINQKGDLYDTSKVVIDFDNDGKDEFLYTVTYEYTSDDIFEISEKNYSIMYYVDDDNYIKILAESNPYYEGDSIIFPNYMIRSIIDINNDEKYELIVMNRKYDKTEYEIYNFVNNSYELVFATDMGGIYEK